MSNGYNIDTLNSADNEEKNKTGVKLVEKYEGVIYTQYFKTSAFRKSIERLVNL